MNILILNPKTSDGKYYIYDTGDIIWDELKMLCNNDIGYNYRFISSKETINCDSIESIAYNFDIRPSKWLNDKDYLFSLDDESLKSIIEKLIILWDKYGLYQDDESLLDLRENYKRYINEGIIKNIIE